MRRAALLLVLLVAGPAPARATGGARGPELGATAALFAGGARITTYPDQYPSIVMTPVDLSGRAVVDATWHLPLRLRAVLSFEATGAIVTHGPAPSDIMPTAGSGWVLLAGVDLKWFGVRVGVFRLGPGVGAPYPGSIDDGYATLTGPLAWRIRVGPFGPLAVVIGHFDEIAPARFAASRLGVRLRWRYLTVGADLAVSNWGFSELSAPPGWYRTGPTTVLEGEAVEGLVQVRLTPRVVLSLQGRDEPFDNPAAQSTNPAFGWAVSAGVRVAFGTDRGGVSLLPR